MSGKIQLKNPTLCDESWVLFDDPSEKSDGQFKLPPHAPLSGIFQSHLKSFGEISGPSSHNVKKMIITKGPDNGTVVYFKPCGNNYPHTLAQIEAAASASYRIVRRDRAARVRPVINKGGKVIGSISYGFFQLKSMMNNNIKAEDLIEMGIAEELVARYTRQEDDLHPDNMGVFKGKIVGYDYDMSYYGMLTHVLKGSRIINGLTAPFANRAFFITQRDLASFPDIQDAQPCYWPTKSPNNKNYLKEYVNKNEFQQLGEKNEFKKRVYLAFLKELLIDPKTHFSIMERNFPPKSHTFNKLKKGNEERYQKLETELIQLLDFRKFILKDKYVLKKCLKHFYIFNKKVASTDGQFFDLMTLKKRYKEIVKKCMIKDLILAFYDLGFRIKSNRYPEDFKIYYDKLIDITSVFENNGGNFKDEYNILYLKVEEFQKNIKPLHKQDWKFLCNNIKLTIRNYRSFIPKYCSTMLHSVYFPIQKSMEKSFEKRKVEIVESIANAVIKWISQPEHTKKVIAIVHETIKEYSPWEFWTPLGPFIPGSYTRGGRKEELEKLINDITETKSDQEITEGKIAKYVAQFTSSGQWNMAGFLSITSSANVILIHKLCDATLEAFRNNLSLKRLKKHELVEVCYNIQRKQYDPRNSVKEISYHLTAQINKLSSNNFELVESTQK